MITAPVPPSGKASKGWNTSAWLPASASEAAFLLGGIGTGNVSLGARGEFRDWELFNSPGKGNALPYTFAAIHCESAKGELRGVTRVLESRIRPPYTRSHGFRTWQVGGLPRLRDSRMRSEYPFVWVEFSDDDLPVSVSLEAFTPFIPLNADDSSLPAAVLRYHVANCSDREVQTSIAMSLANAVGFSGYGLEDELTIEGNQVNAFESAGPQQGLTYASDLPGGHVKAGTMALVAMGANVTAKPAWLSGHWGDGLREYWEDFSSDGQLEAAVTTETGQRALNAFEWYGRTEAQIGSLAISATIPAQRSHAFEFVLTWHFPNRPAGWSGGEIFPPVDEPGGVAGNHYTERFRDAWDVAKYVGRNLARLESGSRKFRTALYETTVPPEIIDAVAANITALRSTACFRIDDGTFLGWEGTDDTRGSCEGSCTHVWNFAQTAAFLFPELEQSMRRVEFLLETDQDGRMAFRTNQVFGQPRWEMLPAADGQLGTVVRLYREWLLSGDDDFLRTLWPAAKRAIDYALKEWDSDHDCVLDREQHVGYDLEWVGANPYTNSLLYAALRAAALLAEHLGETEAADRYRQLSCDGSRRMDELLWNGEYYVQKGEEVAGRRYQFGGGCLSDQLLGQFLAHVCGLGYVLPREHVRTAVKAIFAHNFQTVGPGHLNTARTFMLDGEAGLALCTWPRSAKAGLPFPHAEEVWTGVEYSVAALLLYEGFCEEAVTLVRAVRQRYDGHRRNPWSELEAGHHYVRSMASWALLLAASGFEYDVSARAVRFEPKFSCTDFATFWSNGRAWGVYRQCVDPETGQLDRNLEVLYGDEESVSGGVLTAPVGRGAGGR